MLPDAETDAMLSALVIALARERHKREHPLLVTMDRCTDPTCQQATLLIRERER